jgi:hypothetical protein
MQPGACQCSSSHLDMIECNKPVIRMGACLSHTRYARRSYEPTNHDTVTTCSRRHLQCGVSRDDAWMLYVHCHMLRNSANDGDPYRREVCFPWGIDTRLGRIAIDIHSSVTFGLSCKSQERLLHSHTVVPMRIPHLRSAGLRWLPCFQRHPAGT